jgi:hypothetical protein
MVIVNSVVDEVQIPARLDAIMRSQSSRDAVAERSYWHPNGFLKLVLEGASGAPQLRLHVWTTPRGEDDIHDHAWAYRSLVLAGAVREVRYADVDPGPDTAELWRHSYRPTGGGRFHLDAPQRVSLRVRQTRILTPGVLARGGAECIHRFSAIMFPAVTLLAVGRPVRCWSSVFRLAPVIDLTLKPVPATPDEVATWVAFARAAQCST